MFFSQSNGTSFIGDGLNPFAFMTIPQSMECVEIRFLLKRNKKSDLLKSTFFHQIYFFDK